MGNKTTTYGRQAAQLRRNGLRSPFIFLFFYSFIFSFFSCEKDINIDYHEVSPIYVVEGSITQSSTKVRITQTHNMDDNSNSGGIEGATVRITSGDSINVALKYSRNGYYLSTLKGIPGTRYTLDIELDGHHYTSTSTMQPMPTMNSFRFVWTKIATERYLMGDLHLQDIPNATNYYFIHVYRNNVGYRWAVLTDKQRDASGDLQQIINCVSEREMNKGTSSDVLFDGDKIRIEMRAIDKAAYDYLYSMQLMENTGTNPIANFTGGCLGYFSAHSQLTYECTFNRADVEEE